jgi:hypothetical protein
METWEYERLRDIANEITLKGQRRIRIGDVDYTVIFYTCQGFDCAVPSGPGYQGTVNWEGRKRWRIHIFDDTDLEMRAGVLHEMAECGFVIKVLKKLLGERFNKESERAANYDKARNIAHAIAMQLEQRFLGEKRDCLV